MYVVAPVEVQVSSVQARLSEQFGPAPAEHVPDWQESFAVHPFESALHAVPFGLYVHAVWLVVLVHCWQALDGFASPSMKQLPPIRQVPVRG